MLENLIMPGSAGSESQSYWVRESAANLGKRYLGAAFYIDSDMYILGGSSGPSWYQDIVKYNKTTKRWDSIKSDTIFNGYNRAVYTPDGRILVAAPTGGGNNLFAYYPSNINTRYAGPPLGNLANTVYGMVMCNGKLYVFQNINNRNVLEINLSSNTATVLIGNYGFYMYYADGLVAMGTDIYVFGGASIATQRNIIKVSTISRTATVVGQMPVAINGHFAYALDSKNIAIIGGRPAEGSDNTQNVKLRRFNIDTNLVTEEATNPGFSFVLASSAARAGEAFSVGGYDETTSTARFATIV